MGSTYLRRPCKPWPRTHRDTCRVNESPREARELSASRLKAWVRFLTLLLLLLFFFKIRVYKRNNEQLIDASLFFILCRPSTRLQP